MDKICCRAFLATALCGLCAATALCQERTWSTADGKYSTEATFVDFADQRVQLRKGDGTLVAVPLRLLSDADRDFVRKEMTRRRNERTQPSREPPAAASSPAWPRWRGVNNDGKSSETGLLAQWPPDGPPLTWQIEGLGTGYGSVSVADGQIFVMGRQQGTEYLFALDEKDGSRIWSTPVGPGSRERGPNCTPTIDGDKVYGLSFEGVLICCDRNSGREVWKSSFPDDFGGRMMSGWGYSESVLVDGDRVICTPGGSNAMIAALDKNTGRAIWTTPMQPGGDRGKDGAGYSSIVISNAGGVKQYIQVVGRGVISVAADNGRMLWGYNRIANGTANIPTPIVDGDLVFCSTGYGDGGTALLRISGNRGQLALQEVYYKSAREMQNHHGGMIQIGDFVYFGNKHNEGFPICVNVKTGQVAWEPGRGAGRGSAAIVYAEGHLYFRYQDGTMALIEANPQEYRLKSSFRIASNRGESWPHPVIANGKLYLRDQEALLCYDISK